VSNAVLIAEVQEWFLMHDWPEGNVALKKEYRKGRHHIYNLTIALTASDAENARLREVLKETLEMAELYVPVPLKAPGFKRARQALEGDQL